MATLKKLDRYRWGNDEDFARLGFERWEEGTINSGRKMHFHRVLGRCGWVSRTFGEDADWGFRLCVKYTVYISDARDVPTSENFDYSFEDAFVQVFDRESRRRVDECQTRVTTVEELHAHIASFTSK